MEKVQKFNAKVRSAGKRPELQAGDIVRIHRKIKEGGRRESRYLRGLSFQSRESKVLRRWQL